MRVTAEGRVTIPKAVRDALGIRPAETEVEFVQDGAGRWYLRTIRRRGEESRFRRAHEAGRPRMSSDELSALTRGDAE